jgi:hypothetical protein
MRERAKDATLDLKTHLAEEVDHLNAKGTAV